MGGLLKEIREQRSTRLSKFEKLIAALPEEDAKDLVTALKDPDIKIRQIVLVLAQRGHKIHHSCLYNQRELYVKK